MFGLGFGILYFVVIGALVGLAIYALVLLIVFLRLRIRELKAVQGAGPSAGPEA